jgi:hypothetical protein
LQDSLTKTLWALVVMACFRQIGRNREDNVVEIQRCDLFERVERFLRIKTEHLVELQPDSLPAHLFSQRFLHMLDDRQVRWHRT